MECQEWQKKYPVRRKKTSSPAGESRHSAGEYEGYLLQERKFGRGRVKSSWSLQRMIPIRTMRSAAKVLQWAVLPAMEGDAPYSADPISHNGYHIVGAGR